MKITLGITGSISAYKAIYILRGLKKRGDDVHCVLTAEAKHFVPSLTLSVLSGNEVLQDAFTPRDGVVHINLAENDLILLAPATYNIIGKIASGIADDLLTSVVAAAKNPVVIVPAMNPDMWENPIMQHNIRKLKSLGYFIMEPEEGELSCGGVGTGRLPEPDRIIDYVHAIARKACFLKGARILVTTGRTEEEIDPIRVISNKSSGLMGYEIAVEAKARGASVTLVKGKTDFPIPWGIGIKTTAELEKRLMELLNLNDIIIMASAVSDFRPEKVSKNKLKRKEGKLTIKLTKTDDILKKLRKEGRNKLLIGFCVEGKNLLKEARGKLREKSLDMIVANHYSVIASKDTEFSIIKKNGDVEKFSLMSKREAASIILDKIEKLWRKKGK